MRTSAPKKNLWIIALVLGILGIVAKYVAVIPIATEINYYLLLAGFVLLALGTSFKGM